MSDDRDLRETQVATKERQVHEVDLAALVPGLQSQTGKPITKAVVRLLHVAEGESAKVDASAYVARRAPSDDTAKEIFFQDATVLENATGLEVLFQAFRDPSDPKWPLFESVTWMRNNLTAQTVGQLANVYTMVEAQELPAAWPDLTPEQVEEHRAFIWRNLDNDLPELRLGPHVLSEHGRPFLVQLACMMAVRWTQERDRCREALELARAELADGPALEAVVEALGAEDD